MTEVVIDTSVGGLDLSAEGKEWLYENARDKFFGRVNTGPRVEEYEEPETLDPERFKWSFDYTMLYDEATRSWWYFNSSGTLGNMPEVWEPRADEDLIHAVKEFGGGEGLKVVEIPDDINWYIDHNEDGSEYVTEAHRTWA